MHQAAAHWLAAALCGPFAGTLVASPAIAQDPRDPLTTSIEAILVEEGLVGAIWALVTPEGTTIGAAGLNDASRQRPMSPDDRVQVGSVGKTLLATGVLQLVTLDRIDLDAPVRRYLPEVPIENRWEPESPLRVRHLIDHTGGLDDARMWQVFSLRAEPDAPLRESLTRSGSHAVTGTASWDVAISATSACSVRRSACIRSSSAPSPSPSTATPRTANSTAWMRCSWARWG